MPATALQSALFDGFDTPADCAGDRLGFDIGRDFARHALVPPASHLHTGNPVREGWQTGQAAFRGRTLPATPAVRQWLQLRLHAWARGHEFEGTQLTPHLLEQLAVSHCPVTGEALTHDTGADTDSVVERLNAGAAYAAGNVAVMSRRAAAARANAAWDDALGFARQIRSGSVDRIAGLDADAWERLAVLISLATPLTHRQASTLPLTVLPPNRVRVLNPVQALQTLLTLVFTRPGYARQLTDLAAVMPSSVARQAFQVFMHTLLARRVAAGPVLDGAALKRALADAWRHPLVQRRWARLAETLTLGDCEHLVQWAGRKRLVGPGCEWISRAAATDGWALETQGRRRLSEVARVERPRAVPAAPRPAPTPAVTLAA